MVNPFFKNSGPYKLIDILNELNLRTEEINNNSNVIDIKDLRNSKLNHITFFHSKKYKMLANITKASYCITTENLKKELPKKCMPILVDNVLLRSMVNGHPTKELGLTYHQISLRCVLSTKYLLKVVLTQLYPAFLLSSDE